MIKLSAIQELKTPRQIYQSSSWLSPPSTLLAKKRRETYQTSKHARATSPPVVNSFSTPPETVSFPHQRFLFPSTIYGSYSSIAEAPSKVRPVPWVYCPDNDRVARCDSSVQERKRAGGSRLVVCCNVSPGKKAPAANLKARQLFRGPLVLAAVSTERGEPCLLVSAEAEKERTEGFTRHSCYPRRIISPGCEIRETAAVLTPRLRQVEWSVVLEPAASLVLALKSPGATLRPTVSPANFSPSRFTGEGSNKLFVRGKLILGGWKALTGKWHFTIF